MRGVDKAGEHAQAARQVEELARGIGAVVELRGPSEPAPAVVPKRAGAGHPDRAVLARAHRPPCRRFFGTALAILRASAARCWSTGRIPSRPVAPAERIERIVLPLVQRGLGR